MALRRRLPAIERSIADIRPDRDIRVRLLGTVIDSGRSSLVIDDGSGRAEIVFDSAELFAGISSGQLVRVITRILPLADGYECRGECVQSLQNFDISLYKKAKDLIK
jgi:hypothetical protein